MGRFIPLSIPNFEGNEEAYVRDAVSQGWVSTGGDYINEFECKLAEFIHVPETAACQSGTAAIHLALRECGVGPGDMVIVPTLTFIAAVNPVKYQFADPIFMDCDESLCMDPVKLERFCRTECEFREEGLIYKKSGKTIKALVVVHVFGNLADMDAIMKIADEYRLFVVEDATEALGSYFLTGSYAGKMAGTIGDFGTYSFNGNKIITTGGGGAVTAKDSEKLRHIKYVSTQSKDDTLFYIHNEIGFNYRMTNLQAALGVAQMEELPEFIRRKQENYKRYRQGFDNNDKICLMPFRQGTASNHWLYALFVAGLNDGKGLSALITKLQEYGIQTRPIWGLIHVQKPYADDAAYMIEKAPYYQHSIINIPCSTQITEEEIDWVIEKVLELI